MYKISIRGIAGLAYKVYFGIVFFLVLLFYFPVLYFLLQNEEQHFKAFRVMKMCSYTIQIFTFTFSTKTKKINVDHPQIICANHTSYLDIISMYTVYNRPFLFLGKSELLSWPLIGMFFKKMNIAVDRKNKRAASKALEMGRKKLEEGWSLVIFPEGTIPVKVPKLHRFKNGAFKLAIEEQVPILPITFLNHWKIFSDPTEMYGPAYPGIGVAHIHEEITTQGLTAEDLVPLREEVFQIINAPNVAHNKEAIEKLTKRKHDED